MQVSMQGGLDNSALKPRGNKLKVEAETRVYSGRTSPSPSSRARLVLVRLPTCSQLHQINQTSSQSRPNRHWTQSPCSSRPNARDPTLNATPNLRRFAGASQANAEQHQPRRHQLNAAPLQLLPIRNSLRPARRAGGLSAPLAAWDSASRRRPGRRDHSQRFGRPRGLLADARGAGLPHRSRRPFALVPLSGRANRSNLSYQIGGSLAKVVYFTRAPKASSSNTSSPSPAYDPFSAIPSPSSTKPRTPSPPDSPLRPNGVLRPHALSQRPPHASGSGSTYPPFQSKRRSSTSKIPTGGRLNFVKFETTDLTSCISFLSTLISSSAASNRVPLEVMKRNVKIMATGGGAHKFYQRLRDELGVEVRREEEMECLVLGLGFVMEVPNEVFWYSDELVQAISHPHSTLSVPAVDPTDPFPRPSPNPPQYSLSFDPNPAPAQFPCLLVNIGSGVSIIKVDDYGKFERISGTSLGGGTLWGLLSLLTGAKTFDGALRFAGGDWELMRAP